MQLVRIRSNKLNSKERRNKEAKKSRKKIINRKEGMKKKGKKQPRKHTRQYKSLSNEITRPFVSLLVFPEG